VDNKSPNAIVTFDGAGGKGEGEFPDLTGQCYVSFHDGVACVQRIRPGAHPTRETTRIFIPVAAEVGPGERRNVKFRLPLPVKERAEYTPDFPGASYEKRLASRMELRIGYFFKTPETLLKPTETPGTYHVARGAPLSETQQMTQTCDVALDVLARTDAAFLRM
jgi:hypothetical protein